MVARISFLKPTDQPTGAVRLLAELHRNLADGDLDDFRMIVAFAKLGPLLRLAEDIEKWTARGCVTRAVLGVDQKSTSSEALEFAHANFQEAYVACVPGGPFSPTFHPKLYLFAGDDKAVAYVGSNNLTVGGTETNLETYVKLELEFPADRQVSSALLEVWDDALRTALPLTTALLSQLVAAGMVLDESQMRTRRTDVGAGGRSVTATGPVFPALPVAPPSALPRRGIAQHIARTASPARPGLTARPSPPAPAASIGAEALVIQIIPHPNGEVHLSKGAVDQEPAFFGWPFTGQTVPKKPSNPSYPQREPDPVVDLRVYNASGALIVQHRRFNLNTVYYATNSEIRITVPQDVVRNVPEYSVLMMQQSTQPGLDYEMDIYIPGGNQYGVLLAACNQTMPSGGKAVARRFGWL